LRVVPLVGQSVRHRRQLGHRIRNDSSLRRAASGKRLSGLSINGAAANFVISAVIGNTSFQYAEFGSASVVKSVFVALSARVLGSKRGTWGTCRQKTGVQKPRVFAGLRRPNFKGFFDTGPSWPSGASLGFFIRTGTGEGAELDRELLTTPPIPLRVGVQWEEPAMKTTILAYVIALGGIAMIVVGLWGLYILIRERVAELHLRDYLPPIQTIAVGLVLIGLARALQLLLVIFHTA
jgi:hypothetical protein